MPDKDKTFSGSLVFDLRIWESHVHTLYINIKPTTKMDSESFKNGYTLTISNFKRQFFPQKWPGLKMWIDNRTEIRKLMFRALGLTLETPATESLYGGQFTLWTQLIKPNYFVVQCLETLDPSLVKATAALSLFPFPCFFSCYWWFASKIKIVTIQQIKSRIRYIIDNW